MIVDSVDNETSLRVVSLLLRFRFEVGAGLNYDLLALCIKISKLGISYHFGYLVFGIR